MFAARNWDAIAPHPTENVAFSTLPLRLLSPAEMAAVLKQHDRYANLFASEAVRSCLFYLGGVPGWAMEYLDELELQCGGRCGPQIQDHLELLPRGLTDRCRRLR